MTKAVPQGTTMPWPADAERPNGRHLRALVSCDAVTHELPFIVEGSRRPSRAMEQHLLTCLSCQAELAGYRRLLRALKALRDQPVPTAVPELVGATLGVLQSYPYRVGRRAAHRWLLAASLMAGAALVGAGALALRSGQPRSITPSA